MKVNINEIDKVYHDVFNHNDLTFLWDSHKSMMTIIDLPEGGARRLAMALRELFAQYNTITYCAILDNRVRVYNPNMSL